MTAARDAREISFKFVTGKVPVEIKWEIWEVFN
jgi:hypothetical protein